jgi:hypothetical protein
VLCGDESRRFLAFAAADLQDDAIAVPSALLLLDDLDFYVDHSRSLRSLHGRVVARGSHELGELRDLLVRSDGSLEALVVEDDGSIAEIGPVGATLEPDRVPAG